MILDDKIKLEIKAHALSHKDEEVCGFICFNNFTKEVYPCSNFHSSKSKFFTISPLDYVHAAKSGEILGVYHSHINDNLEFSLSDRLNSSNHSIPFILYNVGADKFVEYIPDDYEIPYIGRNFSYGKSDCFTLVKDYYKKELGITIIDNFENRTEKWFEENSDTFLIGWKRDNPKFIEVIQPRKHDILLFNYYRMIKAPHHLGIYLGNGTFLHHPRDKYSTIDLYSDSFIKKTFMILRYDES